MEHTYYRDNLEDILAYLNGKRLLTTKEICQYTGKTYRWVVDHFGLKGGVCISAPTLARKLCEMI